MKFVRWPNITFNPDGCAAADLNVRHRKNMVADTVKKEPSPGELLWEESDGKKTWRAICLEIVHPILSDEPDEDGLFIDPDSFWLLRIESSSGETFESRWHPSNSTLCGEFKGWSKSMIGRIKTALIQHKWQSNKNI